MGKIVSRIRQARLDYAQRIGRDVSAAEVARAIGISRAALRKIENGEVSVSFPVLAQLCDFYKLQPGDLLEYEDQRTLHLAVA
jgi:DNA-binding Xre family transcriptional regulator